MGMYPSDGVPRLTVIRREERAGRVGEEAIPHKGGTTTSPLVEPDVQISRIRLSRKLSPQGSTLAKNQLSRAAKPRSPMRMVPQPRGCFLRRWTGLQAAFPSSYLNRLASRPLPSTVVTRFFANMGRSDSRTGPSPGLWIPPERWLPPPRRVSQVPRLLYPRPPSPTTPESPVAASPLASPPVAGFIRSGSLAALALPNQAESGSLAPALRDHGFAFQGFGGGITPTPAGSATLSNEQLQGKLLSAYKISQAYPGAPGLRYACYPAQIRTALNSIGTSSWVETFKPSGEMLRPPVSLSVRKSARISSSPFPLSERRKSE